MSSFVIGLAAGAWHLGFTAARARSLAVGRRGLVVAAGPLAWAGPVAGLLLAAQLDPDRVAWVVPGLWVARLVLLEPLSRWVGR